MPSKVAVPYMKAWVMMLTFASAGIAFLSSAFIFIPMARRGTLHGKGLLVGGAFYLVYLVLVIAVMGGVVG